MRRTLLVTTPKPTAPYNTSMGNDPQLAIQPRRRGRAALQAMLAALGLLVAACSSDDPTPKGVASLGDDATTTSAPDDLTEHEQWVRYAQCMREHDVPMPDPNPGEFRVSHDENGGVRFADVDSKEVSADTLAAAERACEDVEPVLPARTPEQDAELRERRLLFSQCMREHGVEDFPDPDASGHYAQNDALQDPDHDDANETCRAEQPERIDEEP